MNKFKKLHNLVKTKEKKTIVVACAGDKEVLSAVKGAVGEDLANFILTGNEQIIREIAEKISLDLTNVRIINAEDKFEACSISVRLVANNEGNVLMKGLVDTSVLLKEVLKKEYGLRTGKTISHVMVVDLPAIDRFILLTDGAMNITPDEKAMIDIIKNSVEVANKIGIETPKVACLSAVEKVNEKMPATILANKMQQLNEAGEIPGCIVAGPLAVDNAMSKKAAEHKGITHPVAGNADILAVPFIEVGNALYKGWVFGCEGVKSAGILVGAKIPIIVTSRADSDETKLNSIALSML